MHTPTRSGARAHTHTHSQICSICCFSTATMIRERAPMLRYTYIVSLVICFRRFTAMLYTVLYLGAWSVYTNCIVHSWCMCGCFRLTTLTVHLRHGRHTNGIPSLVGGMSVSVIHVYLLIMSLYSEFKGGGEEGLMVGGGGGLFLVRRQLWILPAMNNGLVKALYADTTGICEQAGWWCVGTGC